MEFPATADGSVPAYGPCKNIKRVGPLELIVSIALLNIRPPGGEVLMLRQTELEVLVLWSLKTINSNHEG